jgi:ubiquinol-cytochrome c reductase iron-sulfur subunit
MKRWLLAALVLLLARARRRPVPPPSREPNDVAERVALLALGSSTLCAIGFMVCYFTDADTQWLGLALGLSVLFAAVAAAVGAQAILPQDKHVEPRPQLEHPEEQEQVRERVAQAGEGVSRKRLLTLAAGGAATAIGGALILPALSLGPAATGQLRLSPWRRGKRLVDEHGTPIRAADVGVGSFRTAFPEGADKDLLASPVVVVRIHENELALPRGRESWAPSGILAFSKICTHAGCAIALFRYPLYEPTSSRPALVCPCHYSTFDVRRGAEPIFGPAARPLPQLPLAVDSDGMLRAGGDFSGLVGPSWWKVRTEHPS